jgi:hypothetical protein
MLLYARLRSRNVAQCERYKGRGLGTVRNFEELVNSPVYSDGRRCCIFQEIGSYYVCPYVKKLGWKLLSSVSPSGTVHFTKGWNSAQGASTGHSCFSIGIFGFYILSSTDVCHGILCRCLVLCRWWNCNGTTGTCDNHGLQERKGGVDGSVVKYMDR